MSAFRGMRFFLTLIILNSSFTILAQNSSEKKLLNTIYTERNAFKKFEKILVLGHYYQSKNIDKADSIKTVILQKSKHFDLKTRLNALLFSAETNLLTGNLQGYKSNVLEAESFLTVPTSPQNTFSLLSHLGNLYSNLLDFNKADFFLRKSLLLAKQHRNYNQITQSDNLLALNFMRQNEKDSAMQYVNRSIQYARRSIKNEDLSLAIQTQATIYKHFGQLELSLAKNILALEFSRKINDVYQRTKLNLEIGKSQRNILNLDDAEYYFKLAIVNSRKIEDNRQLGLALCNLGGVFYERKKLGEALNLTQQGVSKLLLTNDLNGIGEAYNSLGLIYLEKQEFDLARIFFNKALVSYEQLANKEEIAIIYRNVGIVFQKQKKYANALNYLERSVRIQQNNRILSHLSSTYRIMAEIYESIGNEHKALKYIKLYLASIDKNYSLQSVRQIAELSELYRSEQRERLIESQADAIEREKQDKILTTAKLENSQLRNDFQFYIIIAIILIVILILFVLFYRWNQTKIKQQQREAELSQTLLRTQMKPHFVFNAMSVIQSYIYENDTANSAKFLVNFSRLMRLILENSSKEFIPLEIELEIIQKYLVTQQLRFEKRFRFEISVSSLIDKENTFIPPMITQPFIENAIEHGQLHTIPDGMINIEFQRVANMFEIQIIDNGVGRQKSFKKKSNLHKSMAIEITKERIDNLNKKYKTDGFLEIDDFDKVSHTGTKVVITLPFKENNLDN